MSFFPVVERELRVASRRRGTFRTRFLAGVAGVLIAGWIVAKYHGSQKEIGAAVFITEAWLVFAYTAIAGTLSTGDSLSEEKREGTLGLLFLTDLKGRDVVLGKLAATSLHAIYGMFAVLPILTLPLLLGGVAQMEILRVVLVALNLLFLFLCLGLAASALCRREGTAYGLALAVAFGLVFWPIGTQFGARPNPNPRAALLSSPGYACLLADDSAYHNTPGARVDFWVNCAVTQLYAWLFFLTACVAAPRSWLGEGTRWKWNFPGAGAKAQARTRATLLETNPFLWRVLSRGRNWIWLAFALLGLFWLALDWLLKLDLFDPAKDLCLIALAGLVVKVAVAMLASRVMAEDRREGGLELVLTTPLGADGVLNGQRQALWRLFAIPAAAVIFANFFTLAMELRDATTEDRPYFIALHFTLAFFLAADAWTLSETALWRGLTTQKPGRAGLWALGLILFAPVVLMIAAMPLVADENGAIFVTWWGLGIGVDLFFGLRARTNLSQNFQLIVAEGRKRPLRAA